ncbi:MAG: DUF433 domain-containing protein [Betaproteobacteria bacterium]|nr:DUF433 domain-containing protein [Betaproteobacteria bacterium]
MATRPRRSTQNTDLRDQPAYTLAEAARYLKLPVATLRSSVAGRPYPKAEGTARFQPLIHPPSRQPPALSFWNLIEAHVLRSFLSAETPAPRTIAIDPKIAFGRPIIVRAGISTAAIAGRIDAKEPAAEVAADYDLTVEEVEQAVLFGRAA